MPSASDPPNVSGPANVRTYVWPSWVGLSAATGTTTIGSPLPPARRTSWNVSAEIVTGRLNVTVRLDTFDRWADPSFTWTFWTRGATDAMAASAWIKP